MSSRLISTRGLAPRSIPGIAGSSATSNTKLPEPVDLAIFIDVYHECSHPAEIIAALCRSLKPNGRIVFIEYRGEDPGVPIKPLHKMTEEQVKKEMSVQPLDYVETVKTLPRQHLIVFRKRG